LPTRNYSASRFENVKNINAEEINDRFVAKIIACNSCAMRCEHEVVVKEGPYKGAIARIEYDSLWAFGPNVGVDKPDAIIKAAELCNTYGLDAQSTGVTIAFLMDCHEKGILSHEDLGGIDAHFGNGEAVVKLVEKIGKREGIGEKLADGVKIAAEKIGKNSAQLAQHIKGLEVTGYDLRCLKTTALAAAVSFRGADHARSGVYALDMKGKVDRLKAEKNRGLIVKENEDLLALIDSFIVCKNSKGTFYKELEDMAKLYSAVTGIEVTAKELSTAAERIITLAKLINVREGLGRDDDTLPWKVMNEPIPDDGPTKGAVVTQDELDLMIDGYYNSRGWSVEGLPSKEKLEELGLKEFASLIEGKEA